MKIEITKEMENEIDAIIGLGKQVGKIKSENLEVYKIIRTQFFSDDYNKPILDTETNLKVRLYAEIMKKKNELEVMVGKKING